MRICIDSSVLIPALQLQPILSPVGKQILCKLSSLVQSLTPRQFRQQFRRGRRRIPRPPPFLRCCDHLGRQPLRCGRNLPPGYSLIPARIA